MLRECNRKLFGFKLQIYRKNKYENDVNNSIFFLQINL